MKRVLKSNNKISRYEERLLWRKGKRKYIDKEYRDNKGGFHSFRWESNFASLFYFLSGCFKNGFPICVKTFWYPAWAFYPVFIISARLDVEDARPILNHERIHIRQQRDLHIVFGIPLVILSFWYPILLVFIPFIPTIFYLFDVIRVVLFQKRNWKNFREIRSLTIYEMEANRYSYDFSYLERRKFFAVLNYLRK